MKFIWKEIVLHLFTITERFFGLSSGGHWRKWEFIWSTMGPKNCPCS